jgi:hypothetical protein
MEHGVVPDENGVDDLVKRLYKLKGWGKNLQQICDTFEVAEVESYREQPYRVARNKRGWRDNVLGFTF